MKQTLTFLFILSIYLLSAQSIADFENFELAPNSFLDGSDNSGGFNSGNIFLPNDYNAEWGSWTGWAISNATDTLTPGFSNQYSSISGGGANNSSNYAVTFVSGESRLNVVEGDQPFEALYEGLYINNSTYAYLSMLEGDDFAKKFGGATGDDPDFFLLTIKRYKAGELRADSVNFFLADYRFEDNSQDYIIKDWTFVDLSSLGGVDSLSFTLSSSDNGQFGMNTPAYFCVDDIEAMAAIVSVDFVPATELFQLYPNPTADFVQVNNLSNKPTQVAIYSLTGQLVLSDIVTDKELLDIQKLSRGTYMVHVFNEEQQASQLLVKQ